MSSERAVASPHYPVRPDWLSLGDEPVLEPDLPIVDAHHHLWDRPGNRYFFFDFLEDAASGHDIRASVFVECGAMYRRDGPAELRSLGETEFANGVAAMAASGAYGGCKVCAGIVGHADLTLGDRVAPVLEQHLAASDRFRGIRHIAAWHRDPAARASIALPPAGLLLNAEFRRGMAALERLGLSFDSHQYHTQLGELADLARSCPDVPIIVDHVGTPIGIGPYAGKRQEVFADWRARIEALAECPNAHVKLGGLGMRVFGFDFAERDRPPTSAELAEAWAPYIETCIEAFGVDRCLFQSNFPVDKGSCSYRALWNAFKRIAAGASADEKAALFGGTASRLYRLDAV